MGIVWCGKLCLGLILMEQKLSLQNCTKNTVLFVFAWGKPLFIQVKQKKILVKITPSLFIEPTGRFVNLMNFRLIQPRYFLLCAVYRSSVISP